MGVNPLNHLSFDLCSLTFVKNVLHCRAADPICRHQQARSVP